VRSAASDTCIQYRGPARTVNGNCCSQIGAPCWYLEFAVLLGAAHESVTPDVVPEDGRLRGGNRLGSSTSLLLIILHTLMMLMFSSSSNSLVLRRPFGESFLIVIVVVLVHLVVVPFVVVLLFLI
jgi:hypothetical protein